MTNAIDHIITSRSEISHLLQEQCLMEERIECCIENHAEMFSSRLIALLPKENHPHDYNASYSCEEATDDPLSYLQNEQYLLLKPLVPDEGNNLLKDKHMVLTLNFFSGKTTLIAKVAFLGFIPHNYEKAIQVSYPKELGQMYVRYHSRVQVMPDSKVTVTIFATKIGSFKTRIRDISLGGLSYLCLHPSEALPISEKIKIIICATGYFPVAIDATIKRYHQSVEKSDSMDVSICAVMFDSTDMEQKMQLSELIAFAQREYLIREREILAGFNRELENQVKEKIDLLRQKDAQLLMMDRIAGIGTLAAGIAHEINNPLGFLKSSVASLQKNFQRMNEAFTFWEEKPCGEGRHEACKAFLDAFDRAGLTSGIEQKFIRILRGIERIGKIVGSLRGFSRVDQESEGALDLNASIEDATAILASEEKPVTFTKDLAEIPPLQGIPNEINQCLLHLLKNAVDAVAPGGIIAVQTSYDEEKKMILLRITDNGCGMSEDVRRQAFNPFFTTKAVGAGTGVGLSIVENIIKKHHGEIALVSTEGQGTTASVSLPVQV